MENQQIYIYDAFSPSLTHSLEMAALFLFIVGLICLFGLPLYLYDYFLKKETEQREPLSTLSSVRRKIISSKT